MKYIIELEDEPMIANSFHQEINELWKAKGFNSLVFDKCGLDRLTPYTEPDREAIENETWELAKRIADMSYDDFISCFEGETEEYIYGLSYHEVKAKYEAWKKSKEEIHVGDEVEQITASGNPVGLKCVVTKIVDIVDNEILRGITQTGEAVICSSQIKRWWRKTGRHFDEVEKLLKKMEED